MFFKKVKKADLEAVSSRNVDQERQENKMMRAWISFGVVIILLILLFFASINIGSLKVGFGELLSGLFVKYNKDVATIYDLRFPRIIISMLAGAAIAVSGVLFQAVLKNPLADPGIIGISSGASFTAVIITAFAPTLYFFTPIAAFAGGVVAFFMVYCLSWKGGLSPMRIILTGVAVNSLFTGLSSALNSMSGGDRTGVAAIVEANITQKTWDDVTTLLPYVVAGLFLAMLFTQECNLLSLEDKTARGLGVNVNVTPKPLAVLSSRDNSQRFRSECQCHKNCNLTRCSPSCKYFHSRCRCNQFPWIDRSTYRKNFSRKQP